MKLKYYLRGMGIGIILTAIVMGFALGGRKAALSDAEVIKRAKALGMVETSAEVLTETQTEDSEATDNDTSSSNQTLDQIGEKIPEEINTEVALSDPSVPELVQETPETETDVAENGSSSDSASQEKSETEIATADTEQVKEPETKSDDSSNSASTEETLQAPVVTDVPKTSESAPTDSTTSLNSTSKTVTIPGGMGSDGVASILAREGIIDNAVAFNKYLVERRVDRIIRSGSKTIPANATYEEIARIITTG